MTSVTTVVDLLKTHYAESQELFRVVMNACSPFEANLALDILRETAPERVLVSAVNLREAFAELPTFPAAMAVDDTTLAKVAGFEKDRMTWRKELPGAGCALVITTGGNFCFDLIIETEEENVFWTAIPKGSDMVNPRAVDLVMDRQGLLKTVIELIGDMGLPFSPRFYVTLEDWNLDHAQDLVEDLKSIF